MTTLLSFWERTKNTIELLVGILAALAGLGYVWHLRQVGKEELVLERQRAAAEAAHQEALAKHKEAENKITLDAVVAQAQIEQVHQAKLAVIESKTAALKEVKASQPEQIALAWNAYLQGPK